MIIVPTCLDNFLMFVLIENIEKFICILTAAPVRTPGDDDNRGWVHWTKQGGQLSPALISEDYWPEMAELGAAEQHAARGFTNHGGSQATLFSSHNYNTVVRHFQWMQTWDLDGVAAQRFGVELDDVSRKRVLNYTVAAALATQRVVTVEYDLSGMSESSIVSALRADWTWLVDSLKITSQPCYLHQNGLPVVIIFGFFLDRFSTDTANAILDLFQMPGPYQAFVIGAGQWFWRSDPKLTPAWINVFYRMNSWQPWNAGNWDGVRYASTGYWKADMLDFHAHNVMYQPEIYTGMSTDNRDSLPPGKGRIPRHAGDFLWNQFAVATKIAAPTIFLGMFDELDEGTQILKVTNSPPAQASFITYEGLPSDSYLCWASLGTKMFKGLIPYNETKPNCPQLTQPSIPQPSQPRHGLRVHLSQSISFRWAPAMAHFGGGAIESYELLVQGRLYRTPGPACAAVVTSLADLVPALAAIDSPIDIRWAVRAVNTLGNTGGWSQPQLLVVIPSDSTQKRASDSTV